MLSMKIMIFAVKVNIFLHNLVFLEIVCYVFFYVGYDPRVFACAPSYVQVDISPVFAHWDVARKIHAVYE